MSVSLFVLTKPGGHLDVTLSEDFLVFESSANTSVNPELEQVESLLGISDVHDKLWPRPRYLPTPDVGLLDYERNTALAEGDHVRATKLDGEIAAIRERWPRLYEESTEGWAAIGEYREYLHALLDKVANARTILACVACTYLSETYLSGGAFEQELRALSVALAEAELAGARWCGFMVL